MAEEVSTGGLVRFRYDKGNELKLDDARKEEIREAYARADERKSREKRNRIIFWMIGLVILMILSFLIWRFL